MRLRICITPPLKSMCLIWLADPYCDPSDICITSRYRSVLRRCCMTLSTLLLLVVPFPIGMVPIVKNARLELCGVVILSM